MQILLYAYYYIRIVQLKNLVILETERDVFLSSHSSVNCYVSKAFLDTRTFANVPFILNVTAFIYIIYIYIFLLFFISRERDEKEVFCRYYANFANNTLNVIHIMRRSFVRYDVSMLQT